MNIPNMNDLPNSDKILTQKELISLFDELLKQRYPDGLKFTVDESFEEGGVIYLMTISFPTDEEGFKREFIYGRKGKYSSGSEIGETEISYVDYSHGNCVGGGQFAYIIDNEWKIDPQFII